MKARIRSPERPTGSFQVRRYWRPRDRGAALGRDRGAVVRVRAPAPVAFAGLGFDLRAEADACGFAVADVRFAAGVAPPLRRLAGSAARELRLAAALRED